MGHVFIWIKPNKSKVISVSLCSHLICSERIYRTENSFNNPMKYHHNHRLFYICWMMVIKLKYCKKQKEELLVKFTNKDEGLIMSCCQISPPHEYAALELIQADRRGDWEETPRFTLTVITANSRQSTLKTTFFLFIN